MPSDPASSSAHRPDSVIAEPAGDVLTVWLDHPGKMNAITVAMWHAMREIFTSASKDQHLRCVVVRGKGGAFAAGADITEFPRERGTLEGVMHYHQEILAPALHAIGRCPHPVIAAIDGVCVGGGLEIASQCDLRLATAGSRFGAPINRLGFPMAPEEFRALLTLAGRSVTMELLLEGRILNAEQAERRGLVTRIVADGTLDEELADMLNNLRKGGPLAARINKQTLRKLSPEVPAWNDAELKAFYQAWAEGDEHREGVIAFLESRPASF